MIRRLLLAAGLALACALAAGAARADTFSLVTAPATLPSAHVPNLPGSIFLPPVLRGPPARPQQLSYAQLRALWRSAGVRTTEPGRFGSSALGSVAGAVTSENVSARAAPAASAHTSATPAARRRRRITGPG